MRKKCGTIQLKRLLYLPGGPIISTSHLKMSLSSTRPAENPIKSIKINKKNQIQSTLKLHAKIN